jgi:hypothetical protein
VSEQDTPTRNAAPYGIVQIAAGFGHGAALRSAELGGSMWTWGLNNVGQLGDNSAIQRNRPVHVLDNVTTMGLGSYASYAVRTDGYLYAWGSDRCNVLGDGMGDVHPIQPLPERIPFTGVTKIVGGFAEALAIRSDGTLWRWGGNADNILTSCDQVPLYADTPRQVPGLLHVTSASVAENGDTMFAVATTAPPAQVVVPDLIDDTCNQALTELDAVGLGGTCHGTGNWVGQQSPPAGAQVDRGTIVTLSMTTDPP